MNLNEIKIYGYFEKKYKLLVDIYGDFLITHQILICIQIWYIWI